MSRDEAFKAREKRTHKMTRDGLVERNKVTGEENRISSREQDFKLRERLTDGTSARGRPPSAGRNGHSRRRPQEPLSQDLRQENPDFHSEAPDAGSPAPDTNALPPLDMRPILPEEQVPGVLPIHAPHFQPAEDLPDMPFSGERPGRLQFDPAVPASPVGANPKQHGTEYAQKFSMGSSKPDADTSTGSTPDAKPGKPSRLQFDKDEFPPGENPGKPDKRLEKSRLKAERSAAKLEGARKKLPIRRKPRLENGFDPETGKVKRTLRFEKKMKSQREHLKGPLPLRPVKAGANAAIGYAHTKIHQAEQENVGMEAGHKGELLAEGVVRHAYHLHKTAPYRRVAKWERLSQRHTVRHAYRQVLHDNPQLQSSSLSRFLQKQKIKRQYAKMAREAKRATKTAKVAGKSAGKLTQLLTGVMRRHPVGAGIVLVLLLLGFIIMSMFGSCSNMAVGVLSSVAAGSFVAEDKDVDDAELAYTKWETDLQIKLQNAERDHPGFDEYRYSVDDISHNPYELLAFLKGIERGFIQYMAQILPTGFLGLFLVATLAATLSTVDSQSHTITGWLVTDIYMQKKPNKDDKFILRLARVVVALVLAGFLGTSSFTAVSGIFNMVLTWVMPLVSPMSVILAAGLLTRKTTAKVAWTALIGSYIVFLIWTLSKLPYVGVAVPIFALVVVITGSLLVKASPAERERIDSFFAILDENSRQLKNI